MRTAAFVLAGVVFVWITGCSPFGSRGGPGYTVDLGKVGSGEPAVSPANDPNYWNGTPMDLRRAK